MLTKEKKKIEGGYCCSNPNCSKVFSRPKIIKYYVCPSCQTLVDIPTQTISDQVILTRRPNSRLKKSELKSELTQDQLVSNIEITNPKESVLNEPIDLKLESEEESELKPISSEEEKVELPVEETTASEFSFPCGHFFGYLNERKKDEAIPESCFGCPKSIECMLPSEVRFRESVQELKKWYFGTGDE